MVEKAARHVAGAKIVRCCLCKELASAWPVVTFKTESGLDAKIPIFLPHCALHQAIADADRGELLALLKWDELDRELVKSGAGHLVEGTIDVLWPPSPVINCMRCGRTDNTHEPFCTAWELYA